MVELDKECRRLNTENEKLEKQILDLNEDKLKIIKDSSTLRKETRQLKDSIKELEENNENLEEKIRVYQEDNDKLQRSYEELRQWLLGRLMFKKAKPTFEDNFNRPSIKDDSLMNELEELGETAETYGNWPETSKLHHTSLDELDPYEELIDRRKSISVETIKKTIVYDGTQRSLVSINHFQLFPDEFKDGVKRKDPGEEYFLLVSVI